MQRFLRLLRSNWITASGAVITTLAFMAFVTTLVYLTLHGGGHGPYLGIFAFLLLPAGFVFGIALVPLGLMVYRKHLPQRLAALSEKPIRILPVLGVLTLVNLATVGTAGYEAVHYMDSQQFCGKVCHTVMNPTFEMSLDSPHRQIDCVECHIGSGVGSFIQAKVSGMRQLWALATDSYQRPIPTPVHTMRGAEHICASCHAPSKLSADRLIVRDHFGEEDDNPAVTNVLSLRIGGQARDGTWSGIHVHADPAIRVDYVAADAKREKIDWIRYVGRDGKERIFTLDGDNLDQKPAGEPRRMDCIDCHNQSGHHQDEPDAALDLAIASGRVARELPAIRKLGFAVLHKEWPTTDTAAAMRRDLEQAYAARGGLAAELQPKLAAAAEALATIWRRNVHPDMKVTWGTYPDFSGHRGCFRCHDGNHLDSNGEAITADCQKCHAVLAEKAKDPAILQQLGLPKR